MNEVIIGKIAFLNMLIKHVSKLNTTLGFVTRVRYMKIINSLGMGIKPTTVVFSVRSYVTT